LARTVLRCSLAEARRRIDAAEYRLWRTEFAIEPWGETRDDEREALATMHAKLGPAQPGTLVRAADYQLRYRSPEEIAQRRGDGDEGVKQAMLARKARARHRVNS
jgi:hypothetical protein